jgi:hypothetical protein
MLAKSTVELGLRPNAAQFSLLVLVNAFVGAIVHRRLAPEPLLQRRLGLLHDGRFRHRRRKGHVAAGRDGFHVLEAAGLEGLLEILHRHDAIATDIDAALERHVLRHMGTA